MGRYMATTTIGARLGVMFPFGALFVNTVGRFLMALVYEEFAVVSQID